MRHSSASIILAIFVTVQSFHGTLATVTISFHSDEFKTDFPFEEAMDTCTGSEYHNIVQLSRMGVSEIREDFVNSINVQSIVLEGNNISHISHDAFRSVPNLSCLNIRNNLMFLDDLSVFNHFNLLKLNLAGNRIFSQREVRKFSELNSFSLSLPRLTHLDLSDNYITRLPSNFKSLFPSLTHFYFLGNSFNHNMFYYVPPSTRNLYIERSSFFCCNFPLNISALYLKKVDLRSNFYISSSNLQILSMRECEGLETSRINQLYANNLVEFDLASNGLYYLEPSTFKNMKLLRRLSLESNSFSSFDELGHVSFLTYLCLNFNRISNITTRSIAGLHKLKGLYLRGNHIDMIEEMAFLGFNRLEELDLAKNRLATLPASWMFSLKRLNYLDLRSNLFTTFESMSVNLFLNLKHVFVGKNNVTQIDLSSLVSSDRNVIVHVS